MSDFEKIAVGKEVESFEVTPQFDAYSGVVIVDSEGNEELVGTDTGRTITIPGITREQAQAILADLTGSGFQYQPYTASGAILNPAAELGDGVTINGTYSGIYKMSRNYSPLMTADIEAPQDEEIDHEYPYEPKQDRIYKREIAQAMTRISQTEDAITLEAQRATDAEGVLRSSLMQTASEVSAKVSQTGSNGSGSFSWSLTSDGFRLYSNGTTVFEATQYGVGIAGYVNATSGFIGNGSQGFSISATSIFNGMNSINSGNNGVYIGTNGIALGGGKFKVTSAGVITAQNMTLTGRLTIGTTSIDANDLRKGAERANSGYSSWNGTTSTVNSNGNYWSTGAGYGYTSNKVFNNNQQVTYMNANQLTATSFKLGSLWVFWTWIKDQNGISRHVLASANNGQS